MIRSVLMGIHEDHSAPGTKEAQKMAHTESVQHGRGPRKNKRFPFRGVVTATECISSNLIRVHMDCPHIKTQDITTTDTYVKLLFFPESASYSFSDDAQEQPDMEHIRSTYPREEWPVTRTYTIRSHSKDEGTIAIDFVTHGSDGLAGPWAQNAQPGDVLWMLGPGGAWYPNEHYKRFVFVGDETAAPAIMASLEALTAEASALVLLEVADETAHFSTPAESNPNITMHWVHRHGAPCGTALVKALRACEETLDFGSDTAWFVHGVAEMNKDIRAFLFLEHDVARSDVSVSGYWRLGMIEDEWQKSKRAFNAELDAEEAKAQSAKA